MKRPRTTLSSTCLLAIVWLSAAAATQDQGTTPAKPAGEEQAEAKASWPKLDRVQADRVDQLLANFKMKNEELHEKSLGELIELGAGAAPLLIARMSDAKSNHNAWITRALAQVTRKEHAPLIVEETGSKVLARRCWSVGRLVELEADDVAAVYEKGVADKDPEVAYRASVGLASLGDPSGMDKVFARARTDWKDARAWLEGILPRKRAAAVSTWLVAKCDSKDYADKVAALRLFRNAGVREHARQVASALDSSDHGVKKEAINALRVVVLGEPALDDLSVFQTIEMAKQIKSKL